MSEVRSFELYFERQPQVPSKPRDSKELAERLLSKFRDEAVFVLGSVPQGNGFDLESRKGDQTGRLVYRTTLFSSLESFGYDQNEEDELVNALDGLCRTGRLRLVQVFVSSGLQRGDVQLCFEVGCAVRGFKRDFNVPVLKQTRYYADKPILKTEIPKNERQTLLVLEAVQGLIQAQERRLQAEFGGLSREAEIEVALHRQNIEADLEIKRAIVGMAHSLRKQK